MSLSDQTHETNTNMQEGSEDTSGVDVESDSKEAEGSEAAFEEPKAETSETEDPEATENEAETPVAEELEAEGAETEVVTETQAADTKDDAPETDESDTDDTELEAEKADAEDSEVEARESESESEEPEAEEAEEPAPDPAPAPATLPQRLRAWAVSPKGRLLGFLAAGLLFLELVLAASSGGVMVPALAFQALFSLAGACALYLIATLPIPRRAARIVTGVLLALVGVVFAVMYFVFVQFKIFYDLNTVLGGAGGVAGQFGGSALDLVLSPSGILHVLAFLAPAATFAVLVRLGKLSPEAENRPGRLAAASLGVASFALALLLTAPAGAYHNAYWSQYNFNTNVRDFGLVNSLRREVGHLFGGTTATFTAATPDAAPDAGSADAAATAPTGPAINAAGYRIGDPVALDLDFEALAQSAPNQSVANLDAYVSGLTPSTTNEMTGLFAGKNLIFISAEAFSAEAIREDTTPTLWRMAHKGMQFTDYYQSESAGTTGGECANIFGLLPLEGGSSVKKTASYNNYFTMGNALNRLGYAGWAFHNNTYTYYDRDRTHVNLGYSNGYMGYGNGMERWVTWQWPQSDLEMIKGTFESLYGLQAPFNVYYMSVSGHSGYEPGENQMSQKHWDKVAELPYCDRVRGYLACQIELDAAMEYLVGRLQELGIADDTVIVIGADHFPYGLDDDAALGNMPYLSELYGYNVETYFQRDHNRLIIWSGCLEDQAPIVVDEPTSSVDILPTLLNLFGCEWDSRLLPGRDVFSDTDALVFFPDYSWRTELGTYYAGSNSFEPAEGAGEAVPEGYVDQVNAIVANKMNYCDGLLNNDYFRHLFGDPGDLAEVNAAGREANAELASAARAAYAHADSSTTSSDSDPVSNAVH